MFVIPGNDATYTACASDMTIVAHRIVAMSAKNRSRRGSFASPAITGTVSNPPNANTSINPAVIA